MTLAPILFVFANIVSIVQEPPPPPLAPPPPPGLPVDGLVIFLLVLGVLYGIKKKLNVLNSNVNL